MSPEKHHPIPPAEVVGYKVRVFRLEPARQKVFRPPSVSVLLFPFDSELYTLDEANEVIALMNRCVQVYQPNEDSNDHLHGGFSDRPELVPVYFQRRTLCVSCDETFSSLSLLDMVCGTCLSREHTSEIENRYQR